MLANSNPSGVRLAASCAEDLSGVKRGVTVAAPPSLRGGSRFSAAEPPPEEDSELEEGDDGKEEYHVEKWPTVGCDNRCQDVSPEPDVDSVLREERCLDDTEPYQQVDEDGKREGDAAEKYSEKDDVVEVGPFDGEIKVSCDKEGSESD